MAQAKTSGVKTKKVEKNIGTIVQAVGPIIDVRFREGKLPKLLTALSIPLPGGKRLVTEVLQHIGDDTVRSVSMGATEGLIRGMEVIDT